MQQQQKEIQEVVEIESTVIITVFVFAAECRSSMSHQCQLKTSSLFKYVLLAKVLGKKANKYNFTK